MKNSNLDINILLAVSLALFVLSFISQDSVQISRNMALNRLFYPLFHANLIHAILNIFCILQLAFYYRMSRWYLLASYIIAVTAPSSLIEGTLGFSGVIFAALGLYSMIVTRGWVIAAHVALYCSLTAFFSCVNTLLHLYCYAVGFVCSLLITEKQWWRSRKI
nr:MAG TPA: Rhomboid protease GlpG [Caudoviricetes sp.]